MEKPEQTKRIILTGTPGSGKTSIIHALELKGHSVIHEAATAVIAKEQSLGHLEPWKNADFIEKIIVFQKHQQLEADKTNSTVQFFDRSPICTYALALYLNFTPSKVLLDEIDRIQNNHIYEKQVFFIENLGFIKNTEARKISFEESLIFEKIHLEAYQKFGYKCIMVPIAPIEKRVEIILRAS
jgi:predicted ATPase